MLVGTSYFNGGRTAVLRSSDYGATFEVVDVSAYSADGSTWLHCPGGSSTTYRSVDAGNTWASVTGLSISDARPVADPVNSSVFYVYGGNKLYRSSNGGASFSSAGNLPSGGSKRLTVVPGHEGHLWAALNWQGLRHSTDGGSTFQSISGVTYCEAVGTGAAAPGSDYLTIYIWGTINGQRGLYRSTDEGASWTRINDDAHEFGGPANGNFVVGDMNVYGRVYMSSADLGIVYGKLVDSVPWETWLAANFSAAERLDDAISGASTDPDNDNLSNQMEWILGLDPKMADQLSTWLAVDAATGKALFQLSRQAELHSATLVIDASTDLQTWSPIDTLFDLSSSGTSPDGLYLNQEYVQKDPVPFDTVFLRLKASSVP